MVAVGGDTIISYTDALGWRDSLLTPTAVRWLRDIAFGNGRWVAVGAAEGVYHPVWTSSNVVNWIPHPVQTTENLHGVVSLGRRFVTIGNRGLVLQSGSLAPPAHLSGRATAAGFEVILNGEMGATYQLQATDQLPAPSWTTLQTFLLTQTRTNLVDTTATNSTQRYYRAISP